MFSLSVRNAEVEVASGIRFFIPKYVLKYYTLIVLNNEINTINPLFKGSILILVLSFMDLFKILISAKMEI